MGVLVRNPHDCLKNLVSSRQALLSPPRVKFPRNPNPNPNRPNRAQHNRRKRSPNASPPSRASVASTTQASPAKNLVIGQVKILKRGEPLTEKTPDKAPQPAKTEDLDLGSTDRLGPDPEMVPIQIRLTEPNLANGFYAGSAFVASPPPSSLPIPAFFMKKSVGGNDNNASSEIRKLLGLNL